MSLTIRHASGLEYLKLITGLLQRCRLQKPDNGVWEAADMQWAWRRDQHDTPDAATFWIDEAGRAVAAVVTTTAPTGSLTFEVFAVDGAASLSGIWRSALDQLASSPAPAIETTARDDDPSTLAILTDADFVAAGDVAVSCWMAVGDRPPISALPTGYRLLSRADATDAAHHMIRRNGPDVARRLAECSLYDPTCDLFVVAPDSSVAAYGLFWPDPVTGVGLVEPMRTEDEHQGRGLARHVLTAGIERLAGAGCARMKVTYMDDNPVSKHLYTSVGFLPREVSRTWRQSNREVGATGVVAGGVNPMCS